MTYPDLRRRLCKIVWDSDAYVAGLEEEIADPVFSAGGWTRVSSFTGETGIGYMGDKFSPTPTQMIFEDAQLALWLPEIDSDGPWVRSGAIYKTLTGYEPLERVGITFNTNWILRSGSGVVTVSLGNKSVTMTGPGATIWNYGTIDTSKNTYLSALADEAGEIEIRFAISDLHPTFTQFIVWESAEISKLSPSGLLFTMPPDDPMSYSKPLEPFQQVQSAAGFRDGWAEDHANVFECVVRAIPYQGNTDDRSLWWGWDGAGGWRRFIEYFNLGNEFTFYPDQLNDEVFYTCVAMEKTSGKPDPDWVQHRKFPLKFRTVDNSVILGY